MTHANNASIVCFGEVLLRLSAPGKELLLQSPRFEAHVGGAEANVAVGLHRLGHRTRVVSALPDSALGRACSQELRRHGVEVSEILYRRGRMGLYFLTHGAGHRPAEVLYDRANSAFASAPVHSYDWGALLTDASWLHVSGITPAVSPSAADAALRAMQTARSRSVAVSFDCNFRARLWGDRASEAPSLLRRLCEQADLIFGDERDVALILGTNVGEGPADTQRRRAADAAFKAFAHVKHLACTDRKRSSVEVQDLTGCVQTRDAVFTSRPYSLYGVVDRIGAGDAFASGVLHGLINGFALQDVVEFGAAAACLKHSIPGDFNLVSAADVEALLTEQRVDVRR